MNKIRAPTIVNKVFSYQSRTSSQLLLLFGILIVTLSYNKSNKLLNRCINMYVNDHYHESETFSKVKQ